MRPIPRSNKEMIVNSEKSIIFGRRLGHPVSPRGHPVSPVTRKSDTRKSDTRKSDTRKSDTRKRGLRGVPVTRKRRLRGSAVGLPVLFNQIKKMIRRIGIL